MLGHSQILNRMKKTQLDKLNELCKNCASCELHKTRNNIVFSDGNPETAKIVLIGEAPGKDEDEQGKPFVGIAGKRLNEYLEAAGISRKDDLYIINTVKCRPPNNRVPTNEEKEACKNFLVSQIKIIDPKLILLCGATALKSFIPNIPSNVILNLIQNLISERQCDTESSSGRRKIFAKLSKIPLSKIRGQIFEINIENKTFRAMPILHPSPLCIVADKKILMVNDLTKAKKLIS